GGIPLQHALVIDDRAERKRSPELGAVLASQPALGLIGALTFSQFKAGLQGPRFLSGFDGDVGVKLAGELVLVVTGGLSGAAIGNDQLAAVVKQQKDAAAHGLDEAGGDLLKEASPPGRGEFGRMLRHAWVPFSRHRVRGAGGTWRRLPGKCLERRIIPVFVTGSLFFYRHPLGASSHVTPFAASVGIFDKNRR